MLVETLDEQIAIGARTVVHLHQHSNELKAQSRARLAKFLQTERDYLTPSEDERVRQLLVSYWHARNALLDTVAQFRRFDADRKDIDRRTRDRVFLVGFTAAVILVDAGRFLRELCKPNPVVKARLNSPEPAFGIPEDAYNIVQDNMTSPVNAWHLYHANKQFNQRQQQLEECAAGNETLSALLKIAGGMAESVRLSKRRYAKARLRIRAGQLSRAVTEDTFGRASGWVIEMCSRAIGKIGVRPGHRPALPMPIREQLGPLLQPGDVIVTRKQYAATNYFLPGYWPHAILYLGDCETLESLGLHEHENMKPRWERLLQIDNGERRRVLEAMADGVRLRSVLSAFSVDAVTVIRPELSLPQRLEGIGRGLFHESKPYDFDFDFTQSHRLVCTEVVYRSYEGIGGMQFRLTPRVGRMTLAAEDLLRMALAGEGFQLVAMCLPGESTLTIGNDAAHKLRRSIGENAGH